MRELGMLRDDFGGVLAMSEIWGEYSGVCLGGCWDEFIWSWVIVYWGRCQNSFLGIFGCLEKLLYLCSRNSKERGFTRVFVLGFGGVRVESFGVGTREYVEAFMWRHPDDLMGMKFQAFGYFKNLLYLCTHNSLERVLFLSGGMFSSPVFLGLSLRGG